VTSIKITEAKNIHIFVNSLFNFFVIVLLEVKKPIEFNWRWIVFSNRSGSSMLFNAVLFKFN